MDVELVRLEPYQFHIHARAAASGWAQTDRFMWVWWDCGEPIRVWIPPGGGSTVPGRRVDRCRVARRELKQTGS